MSEQFTLKKNLSQKLIVFIAYTLIKTDRFKIEPIKARQKESDILSPTPVIQQNLVLSPHKNSCIVITHTLPKTLLILILGILEIKLSFYIWNIDLKWIIY